MKYFQNICEREKVIMNLYKIRQITEHISDVLIGIWVEGEVKHSLPQYGINKTEKRDTKIILSLKTYSKRYKTIGLTLKSLLLQTVKPDRIIVWLDEDIPENRITEEMRSFEQYGIEYRHRNLDLRPHGKYFYAMQEFPEDKIITVDDDLIYPKNMIEILIKTNRKYPQAVCARRVHLITLDSERKPRKYNEWKYEYRGSKAPSHLLCATGGAGTLYPPHVLPKEAFIAEDIKAYCYNADDLWLKVMELYNGVKVVWAKNHLVLPREVKKSQKYMLCEANVLNGDNDLYIKNLQEKYPMVFSILAEYKE